MDSYPLSFCSSARRDINPLPFCRRWMSRLISKLPRTWESLALEVRRSMTSAIFWLARRFCIPRRARMSAISAEIFLLSETVFFSWLMRLWAASFSFTRCACDSCSLLNKETYTRINIKYIIVMAREAVWSDFCTFGACCFQLWVCEPCPPLFVATIRRI